MSHAQSLINSLEAWVQEETGARKRMLALVERQSRALLASDAGGLEAATRELERELAGQVERSKRRTRLFNACGALWRVPADTLTLSSIAERAGHAAHRLRALRDELRDATAELARKNRRLSAAMTLQRRIVHDLIGLFVQAEDRAHLASPMASSGTLIDAQA